MTQAAFGSPTIFAAEKNEAEKLGNPLQAPTLGACLPSALCLPLTAAMGYLPWLLLGSLVSPRVRCEQPSLLAWCTAGCFMPPPAPAGRGLSWPEPGSAARASLTPKEAGPSSVSMLTWRAEGLGCTEQTGLWALPGLIQSVTCPSISHLARGSSQGVLGERHPYSKEKYLTLEAPGAHSIGAHSVSPSQGCSTVFLSWHTDC